MTHHVRVVARLVPVACPRPRRQPSATWSTFDRAARAFSLAAAARLRLPLVTWGLEQRELATGIADVFAPEP